MATSRARSANKNLVTLATIVAAGASGMFTSKEVHEPLVTAGHVEVNPEMKNDAGELATRATAAGIAAVQGAPAGDTGATAGASAPAEKPKFDIEDGVDLPESVARAGGRTEMYPFETLAAPVTGTDGRVKMQSFFVPGKEPKSLASTVSGARARYARVIEGQTRTARGGKTVPMTEVVRDFAVKADTKNGVAGSRVWRIK
ncbi:MAG: hypothetical protein JWR85_4197 [Marmoricola sp.]|nr:hypothetical protein [Marmoricola sp.]